MKDLVLFVARGLADKPEAVSVAESREDGAIVLRLSADPGDKGKLIGRQGKVVKSIRALVEAAARRAGERVYVEID